MPKCTHQWFEVRKIEKDSDSIEWASQPLDECGEENGFMRIKQVTGALVQCASCDEVKELWG